MHLSLPNSLQDWKQSAKQLKAETYALFLAYKHPDTPWYAKLFAGLVVAYAFCPIDLVPDFIPVLGYLDDLILVPLGITLALKLIPPTVMVDCRAQAKTELLTGKSVRWFPVVVIVTIWIALLVACLLWLRNLLR
jgi:uncharacterized membrane protein YkvA (DUF1232 family)